MANNTSGPSPRGHSRIDQFRECQQRWDYEVNGVPELGIGKLSTTTTEDYFVFGTAWHEARRAELRGGDTGDMMSAAIESIDKEVAQYDHLQADRSRLIEEVAMAVEQYKRQYPSPMYRPVEIPGIGPATELELEVLLPNHALMTVKLDLLAEAITPSTVYPMVVDFKTTGEDMALYLQRYDLDAKTTAYIYAVQQTFPQLRVDSCWIDVLQKPRKNAKDRIYHFGGGITHRSASAVERWAIDAMQSLDDMNAVTQRRRLPVRSTKACVSAYGKVCPHKRLCRFGWDHDQFKTYYRIGVDRAVPED